MLASLPKRLTFGLYLQNIDTKCAYEPVARVVIAFVITWRCLSVINMLPSFVPKLANR